MFINIGKAWCLLIFNINLIKMKTIILILSLFLATSCSNDDNNQTAQSTPITFSEISKGELFNGNYNPTQHGEVFNNSTDWNNFKNNVWQLADFPPESDIDFNNDIVITVFDEPRSTGGHSIDISENEMTLKKPIRKYSRKN